MTTTTHGCVPCDASIAYASHIICITPTLFAKREKVSKRTASTSAPALGATYGLSDTIVGSNFYNKFSFEAIPDPTNGRVNYVNQATARRHNLTYASSDTFILRADFRTRLGSGGAGRNSARLKSNAQYSTHVAVFNIRHMPQGCGTWPAVWEVGPNWPDGGEIDIVEGVNDISPNAMTLHTRPGCTMPSWRSQTGTSTQLDCNANVNSDSGCGVKAPTLNSFGPSFNSNGGGWHALERTNNHINVWFWPRNAGNVPADVKNGAASVNTGNWGTPTANFPNTNCNIGSHFAAANIIINLTFCGDWAGNVYPNSCPSSCVDHVNRNPGAFSHAYFDFASIRVYQ